MICKEQLAEWFDCFWVIYWRKVAKRAAHAAFNKQVTSEEIFAAVMDGVRLQHCHMMKRQPEFRPHATTWLNGWRWNDVLDDSGELASRGGVRREYVPFQASPDQPAPTNEEYVTLPVVPTVPEGPTADEWRKTSR